jgi:hypothetical protein
MEERAPYVLTIRHRSSTPSEEPSGEVKRCCTCKEVKPVEDFYFRNRAERIRQAYCKRCKSAYNRRWYAKNQESQKAAVSRTKPSRIAALRALMVELKSAPCRDCGTCFPPEVMDFDHVTGKKHRNISEMVCRGIAVETLMEEVAKCELVCSNCHRLRTLRRREGGEAHA